MRAIIETANTILNALAFSNAGNYSDFQALLRRLDKQTAQDEGLETGQCGLPALAHLPSAAPEGQPMPQAARAA